MQQKSRFEICRGCWYIKFAKQVDLTNLKSDANKLDIDKLENVPTYLNNLKSKVDKLDVDKLVPVHVDLSTPRDVVKCDVVKKEVHNAKVENIEDKMPDTTNLTLKWLRLRTKYLVLLT